MAINELPCLGLYWIVVTSLSTLAQGEIATPIGWLALAINCLTTAGFALIAARHRHAGPALTRALHASLPTAHPTVLDVDTPARMSRRRAARLLLLPPRRRRGDVERIAGISYGDAGAANTLDLYRSTSAHDARPILIHLHGGALRSGRKNHEGLPLIYGLARHGWLCVSANYRLFPAATFPDHLIDVKKVIAWARTHAAAYGADPAAVFLAGGSAGAQLAALAALTANAPQYQPGFETTDTAVSAAITLYGMYGPRSVRASEPDADVLPSSHLSSDAPPFLIVHGDADSVLSVDGARVFAADLRRVSAQPVVYAEIPGAQHSFDMFTSVRSMHLLAAVERFAEQVLRGRYPPNSTRRPDLTGAPPQEPTTDISAANAVPSPPA